MDTANRPSSTEAASSTAGDAPTLARDFERRLLHGLAAEWENASWQLPDEMRRRVRCPLFAIRPMARQLGSWHPDRREIALSRALAAGCRWDDILEVLLHEMAHQVACEALNGSDEPDHGESFRQACRLLGANPKASGSYPTLRERMRQGERLDARDRIVVRIGKLMALAKSSNANEAQAAMCKAHQLIARHNVDLLRLGTPQTYTSIFLGRPRLRHFREAYHLAHLLQDFYYVQGVWVEAWVLDKARMGRVLEISGSRRNVLMAEYVHSAVVRYIDAAWADYRRDKRLNRYRKTDFAVGIIEGFRRTLQHSVAKPADDAQPHLPATMADRALGRYLESRYPRLRSISRQGPGHDRQVLTDGIETGRKLVIHKGITRSDGFRDRRLEHHAAVKSR